MNNIQFFNFNIVKCCKIFIRSKTLSDYTRLIDLQDYIKNNAINISSIIISTVIIFLYNLYFYIKKLIK